MKKKLHIALPFFLLFCCSIYVFIYEKGNVHPTPHTKNSNQQQNKEAVQSTNNEVTFISPYTGEIISKETYYKSPFMAIIENSKAARPQSGLSEADIVYETMAEGGIPRFMALFYSYSPKIIGPIRSARPYFIAISKEYNLPFAHCGGSDEAIENINRENLMSMNEMNHGQYYWRDSKRTAPHNLYTSTDKLQSLISNLSFSKKASCSLEFDEKYWNAEFSLASHLNMILNRFYNTSYDFKNGLYYKSMDKTQTIDNSNNNEIAIKNIVIQITPIEVRADGRLNIKQIGTGKGYVLSNGKYIKINWKKSNESSPTLLTDESGKKIKLCPGKTWWHITDEKCSINFN